MGWRLTTRLLAGLGRFAMIAVGILVLVVTIAWLSGMFETKVEPSWSQRAVRKLQMQRPTATVHEVFKPELQEAIGTLKASSRTIVASKLLATITAIQVSAGDQVKEGDELVQLDSQEFQARLSQAEQLLEAALAQQARADAEFLRNQSLLQQNAISLSEFDSAVQQKKVAEAEVERARQMVLEATVQLSYTKVVSTKAGRIVDRLAEPGDIAQPGKPLLILYDATSLRLEAPVNESLAVQLSIGQAVTVVLDATGQSYPATIDEIVPQADATSRSFLVKVSLPQVSGLYEGMFGRLLVETKVRRHLCLATSAIIPIGQLDFVDVVVADGVLERRLVKLGQLGMPGHQEVLSGVQANETVVLQNGEPLPPLDPELLQDPNGPESRPADSRPEDLAPNSSLPPQTFHSPRPRPAIERSSNTIIAAIIPVTIQGRM